MLQVCISQGTIHPSTADCMHPSAHAGKGPHLTHLIAAGRAVLCPRTRRRCGSASEPGGQPGPSATLQAGGGQSRYQDKYQYHVVVAHALCLDGPWRCHPSKEHGQTAQPCDNHATPCNCADMGRCRLPLPPSSRQSVLVPLTRCSCSLSELGGSALCRLRAVSGGVGGRAEPWTRTVAGSGCWPWWMSTSGAASMGQHCPKR